MYTVTYVLYTMCQLFTWVANNLSIVPLIGVSVKYINQFMN